MLVVLPSHSVDAPGLTGLLSTASGGPCCPSAPSVGGGPCRHWVKALAGFSTVVRIFPFVILK